jgi:RNA polymerase sigma-70 factor (ECF subfamily)
VTATLYPVSTIDATLEEALEAHRRELTGYCYRMLGSGFEAEDAVQETLVRAWRNIDSFEGRSALRSWLYKIATNVCLDMLRSAQRRARPIDLGPATTTAEPHLDTTAHENWVHPMQDERVLGIEADPAEISEYRESIRLAFVAALQHLPARQRAVLILREVLRWQASEVAELLETTVASVNSALQRARATLDELQLDEAAPLDPAQAEIAAKYVKAFEAYDIDKVVALLHDEVKFCMPPYEMWLNSAAEVGRWMLGPGIPCRGSKMIATSANGCPAFAQYRPVPDEPGVWRPWNLQVLQIAGGKIVAIDNFLNTELFAWFGLPAELRESDKIEQFA